MAKHDEGHENFVDDGSILWTDPKGEVTFKPAGDDTGCNVSASADNSGNTVHGDIAAGATPSGASRTATPTLADEVRDVNDKRLYRFAYGVLGAGLATVAGTGIAYAMGFGPHDDGDAGVTQEQSTVASTTMPGHADDPSGKNGIGSDSSGSGTTTVTVDPDDNVIGRDGKLVPSVTDHGSGFHAEPQAKDHVGTQPGTHGQGATDTASGGAGAQGGNVGNSQDYYKGDVYIIEPGDTLSTISSRVGVSVDSLILANNIMNPNMIYANSALLIPRPMVVK